ncbi:hypothetical protein [Variovorax sp. MHTC-1]|uniref:hypothetical protein n=1 Tax=Variovorax sp. MHTC-1 TaxID=2495593 RepID=UPI000F882FC8|nr:hypothetical protein [Variovorax sp. MHTC-1]RST48706.1 hypothetical protein EJI01_25730 [Variovorax sp. MHTC-1]
MNASNFGSPSVVTNRSVLSTASAVIVDTGNYSTGSEKAASPRSIAWVTESEWVARLLSARFVKAFNEYASAMRYWCAWYAARYGQALRMPVAVPVAIQFIVDHAARKADADSKAGLSTGLVTELPPDIDQALVANGYKARLGAPALNTLVHRIAVLSKAHQLAKAPNPGAARARQHSRQRR